MNDFLKALSLYYGLDWLTLLLGVSGLYLVTKKKKIGFLVSICSCCCGLFVAIVSKQYGFIVHNLVLISIMLRGYFIWKYEETTDLDKANS
ncbi:MAG: nicotinamide mononucleotide transporter [Alphaproteobacteria bacterium]|nr:nicotinamide mononucleotide transporter [Alphaproteobacteria bacterium]